MAHLRVSRAAFGLCALLVAVPGGAQYIDGSPPPLPMAPLGAENPGDALARNVRILAQSPRNYNALVGAGRAALDTGDAEAAVGFFGRAADVSPNAGAPKAGMGAALVAMGEASHALTEFDRAARAGAAVSSFAADRGLARDLLGQQALAQADYTLALAGRDPDEARRRLALSQAISGNRSGAMATLAPLAQRRDSATIRVRAFVAALGGDAESADRMLDTSMPGMASRLDPFFRRLASLSPAQKAAAVHLGIIPSNAAGLAATAPSLPRRGPPGGAAPLAQGDRLQGIDALLKGPPAAGQIASSGVARAAPPSTAQAPTPKRIWVQLASGVDESGFGAQFARIAARDPDLFAGIKPYVTMFGDRAKLLIGPFKDRENSEIFLDELAHGGVDGFSWTSPEGQIVRKLATQ